MKINIFAIIIRHLWKTNYLKFDRMNEIIEMKDILKDWQKQIPILSRYSSTSLYMKADLVLLGLKLEKV